MLEKAVSSAGHGYFLTPAATSLSRVVPDVLVGGTEEQGVGERVGEEGGGGSSMSILQEHIPPIPTASQSTYCPQYVGLPAPAQKHNTFGENSYQPVDTSLLKHTYSASDPNNYQPVGSASLAALKHQQQPIQNHPGQLAYYQDETTSTYNGELQQPTRTLLYGKKPKPEQLHA